MNNDLTVVINDHRKFGVKPVPVAQVVGEYEAYKNKNAAFKAWLYHLNKGDKLPRGKFFIGKKRKVKPLLCMDEAWRFMTSR